MSASEDADDVAVARIVKPRGACGELLARDWCEDEEVFRSGRRVRLAGPSNAAIEATIERSWRHQGRLILKFEGVDTIADAERLRGCEVRVPKRELPPPPEGTYYYYELIGCEVLEAGGGRLLGRVEAIQEPGGTPLLEVRRGEREILIPFSPAICVEVDTAAKRIRAELPEGLEELNR